MPVLTAPSADLLGSPVSRGALSQIGKRSLSSGSGRRHAWDSRPTGRYRNLGSSIVLVWVCSSGESHIQSVNMQCMRGYAGEYGTLSVLWCHLSACCRWYSSSV